MKINDGCHFYNNVAKTHGGAMNISSNTTFSGNVIIENNYAGKKGGGINIHAYNGGNMPKKKSYDFTYDFPDGLSVRNNHAKHGGGIAYNGHHAFARAEYIRGNTGVLLSEGAYASLGWRFQTAKAGFGSLGVRFDYFDQDIRNSSREFNYTLGVAYQPWRHIRLQLNYILKQHQHLDQPFAHSLMVMVSGIF
jgi:hypothetical protein